jgi:tungstate transport system substrate-binding protein
LEQIKVAIISALAVAIIFLSHLGSAKAESLILASTTSTENSGLFNFVLPKFEKATDITVRVIASGTGQALRMAENGDADVLIVHHPESEKKFVADGFGVQRHLLMYNDFIILGPKADPAGVRISGRAISAFAAISSKSALFASRGDESGTHRSENDLWRAARIDPKGAKWYLSLGAGMGAVLNTAIGMNAYTLSDRATWAAFRNKAEHTILVEKDPVLFNQYSVIMVNPRRHPHVNAEAAARFIEWLLSETGQNLIREFQIHGEQMFFPNARVATSN